MTTSETGRKPLKTWSLLGDVCALLALASPAALLVGCAGGTLSDYEDLLGIPTLDPA